MKILVDGLGKYRKERWREKLMIYTTWENPLAIHLNELLAQSGEETYTFGFSSPLIFNLECGHLTILQ